MVSTGSVKNVKEVKYVNAGAIVVEMPIENHMVNFFSTHATQYGCDPKEKDTFYIDIRMEMLKPKRKYVFWGEFNGHVSKDKDEYESMHGGFGSGLQTADGE